jgi:hypothetical protein
MMSDTVAIFLFISFLGWIGTKFTITKATKWPIVPATNDDYEWGTVGGMLDSGNRNTWRKLCLSSALSTTNPT